MCSCRGVFSAWEGTIRVVAIVSQMIEVGRVPIIWGVAILYDRVRLLMGRVILGVAILYIRAWLVGRVV